MSKVGNAAKATIYVLGFTVALGIVALLVATAKVAKDVALMLLALILPIVIILTAIYLVYKYLENK